MGLRSTYATDIDTIDVTIDGAVFTVKYADITSDKYMKDVQTLSKPYAALRRRGEVSSEVDRRITATAFVRNFLVGWKNVVVEDGEPPLEFSQDAAIKLFVDLPALFADVAAEAYDMGRFRSSDLKDRIKN